MKIIFLDVDGVLNGYSQWSAFCWQVATKIKVKSLISRWFAGSFDIHESKVRRLAKIVHKTRAKVVLSSSWRDYFWRTSYEEKCGNQRRLVTLS